MCYSVQQPTAVTGNDESITVNVDPLALRAAHDDYFPDTPSIQARQRLPQGRKETHDWWMSRADRLEERQRDLDRRFG